MTPAAARFLNENLKIISLMLLVCIALPRTVFAAEKDWELIGSDEPRKSAPKTAKKTKPKPNVVVAKVRRPASVSRRPASMALGEAGAITRDQFIKASRSELDESLQKKKQELVSQRSQINDLVAGSYDPWSTSLTSKFQKYTLIDNYHETSATAALKYATPTGFSAQVFGDYFEPTDWGALSTRNSPMNLGLSLSQEVISGWGRSQFSKERQVVAAEGQAQIVTAEANFLSQVLTVLESGNGLFSAQCRLRDLKALQEISKRSLDLSLIQRSARTISARDQLRIAEAHLNVERQILAAEYEIESYTNAFAAISAGSVAAIRAISPERFDCEAEVESLAAIKYVAREEMAKLVKRHPNVVSIELQKAATKLKAESYQVQRRPSLQVQTGYTRVGNRDPSKPYDDYYVGLTFTYQFHEDQYDNRVRSLNHDIRTLSVNENQTLLDVDSFIGRQYAQLESLLKQIPVASESLSNTRQILKIIQTQEAIGDLDATVLESAYSAYMNSIISARDLWAQTTSLTQKLDEIRASVIRLDDR